MTLIGDDAARAPPRDADREGDVAEELTGLLLDEVTTGTNTASVVSVDARTAPHTSFVPAHGGVGTASLAVLEAWR